MFFSLHNQILIKGGPQIETENKLLTPAPAGKKTQPRFSHAKAADYAFLSFMMFLMTTQPVYATDVWTKATEIMKDVYNQIVLISTVATIVTASVVLVPDVRRAGVPPAHESLVPTPVYIHGQGFHSKPAVVVRINSMFPGGTLINIRTPSSGWISITIPGILGEGMEDVMERIERDLAAADGGNAGENRRISRNF